MKAANLITTLAIVSLMTGCVTAPAQPDWVNGTSSRYPDAQYLSGGQAATRGRARPRVPTRPDLEVAIAVTVRYPDLQRRRQGAGT
jgi:hypothetical protein